MSLTAICILNPLAGGGQAAQRWTAMQQAFEAQGITAEARYTTAPGTGTDLARQALAEGQDLVVAIGGDGTISEVVNGFFDAAGVPVRPSARLGIIPAGSGSDLARTLNLANDVYEPIHRIAAGDVRRHDLAQVRYTDATGQPAVRLSVNIASLGLGATVLRRMRHLPSTLPGPLRYALGTLSAIPDMRAYKLTWTIDGEALPDTSFYLVAAGTARYFAGGMAILPSAVPNDGLLDLTIAYERPLWELLPQLPKLYDGRHVESKAFHTARGREIVLLTDAPLEIDGEIAGHGPVTLTVMPGALPFIG